MRLALLLCLFLAPMSALAVDMGVPPSSPPSSVVHAEAPVVHVEALDAGAKPADAGVISVVAVVSMAVAPPSEGVVPSIPGIVLGPNLPGEDFTLAEAIQATKAAREAIKAPTAFGVASALTMLIFLAVGFLRKYGGKLQTNAHVKRFIAFAMIAAGGLAMVAPGMSWAQAAFIAGAPLLAMAVHEFTKSSKS